VTEQTGLTDITAAEPSPLSRFMAAALARHAGLGADQETRFDAIVQRLTTALAQGHIRIELDEPEKAVMEAAAVVAVERDGPLVVSGNSLYFGRYYRYEVELAAAMQKAAAAAPDAVVSLDIRANPDEDPSQKRAITTALQRKLCIISGGPGTGKTTLLVTIIRLFLARYGSDLRIGLAAPTGKAAMRMNESIRAQLGSLDLPESIARAFPGDAETLHRLLGMSRFTAVPRYHAANPLPYDVVVVDEASMVDLAMMWRLVSALKPDSRLILVGDRDQLASVESGAVLADCIDSLPENVAELTRTYRFNTTIAELAGAIKNGDGDEAWARITAPGPDAVAHGDRNWLNDIAARCERFVRNVRKTADTDGYPELFSRFGEYMVLCAVRGGRYGMREINRRIEMMLAEKGLAPADGSWYAGKPVMVTANDHRLELFNGDIGLCLPDPDADGELRVWFARGSGTLRRYPIARIPMAETAWAMTIHKSQGSEFEHVVVVLPEEDSRVLCRELLYTAVTRAGKKLTMVMNEDVCRNCASRRTIRHSGLAQRLQTRGGD